MNRRDRLRRVLLLSCSCVRNIAYYHGLRVDERPGLDTPFWRTIHNDFIDTCVLEWCKLFGDPKARHHWSKVVEDAATFATELERATRLSSSEFDEYRLRMRAYRDKFLAHLDSQHVMEIPHLTLARESVACYHDAVVRAGGILVARGFPTDIVEFYDACYEEAKSAVNVARAA